MSISSVKVTWTYMDKHGHASHTISYYHIHHGHLFASAFWSILIYFWKPEILAWNVSPFSLFISTCSTQGDPSASAGVADCRLNQNQPGATENRPRAFSSSNGLWRQCRWANHWNAEHGEDHDTDYLSHMGHEHKTGLYLQWQNNDKTNTRHTMT